MEPSGRVKVFLEGASEAWRVADEIAAAGVPVLITPVANTPASFEALGATLDNARRLTDAGVVVAIQGNGNHREREMRYNAGNAVARGLEWRAGLATFTINPARIFCMSHRIGWLGPAKSRESVGTGKGVAVRVGLG